MFIRLAVTVPKSTKSCKKIPKEFELIPVQEHPRSLIWVSIESD